MLEKVVVFAPTVATCAKFEQAAPEQRSILKPSSFDALSVQLKFICEAEIVAAENPVGAFGTVGGAGNVIAFAVFV